MCKVIHCKNRIVKITILLVSAVSQLVSYSDYYSLSQSDC